MKTGCLYLIPLPISDNPAEDCLSKTTLSLAVSLRYFITEELRSARRFLRKAGYTGSFNDIHFGILNEHTADTSLPELLIPALKGFDTGLLSEAGMPCIADPGANLVHLAHQKGVLVTPLPGPNSLMMALAASGLNGQNFVFHGYLPVEKKAREMKLKEMERVSSEKNQTQMFIEAPYRNTNLFSGIINTCSSGCLLSIACNISSKDEYIRTLPVAKWKSEKPDLHKKPAVFLIWCG